MLLVTTVLLLCGTLPEAAAGPDTAAALRPPPPPPIAARAPITVVSTNATVTGVQLAARHGMAYEDHGNHVLLRGAPTRVRLYPGTNQVLIGGRRITLKVRIERAGGDVLVPPPAARYIGLQIETARSAVASRRAAVRVPPKPIPTRRRPVRKPAPVRVPEPVAVVAPPAAPTAPSAWTPKVAERSWRWIVVHHSDDTSGNAAKYDQVHLGKGWENGLGYHFVIGNGSLSGDGEIEVGPRWKRQIQGAHARNHDLGDNRYNEEGIGIVLVGDFDRGGLRPTRRQMDALVRLTRWLMNRYYIKSDMVVRHCECCATQCPGRYFPWSEYQSRLRDALPVPAAPAID